MGNEVQPDPPKPSGLLSFWQEIRRRKIVRVAITYAVVGWLIMQIASITFEGFGIPIWAFRFVMLMLILGFPIAIIFTWAFELTPDGIKTTKRARAEHGDEPHPEHHERKRNWHAITFAAILPTLIFGTLAIFFYFKSASPAPQSIAESSVQSPESDVLSIAVLPLANMSADKDNEYFAGGVHEDILTNLTRINGLKVLSRTTMLRYAAADMSLKRIGEELEVNYIVEGSVRKIGNHVRVTIQLIDAKMDHHLWANNFERELVDVFATQSELAKEISNSLHLEIQPESVGRLTDMPTTSVKAYDLYIKAVDMVKTSGITEENQIQFRDMLEMALKLDPDFLEAWSELRKGYERMYFMATRGGVTFGKTSDIAQFIDDLKSNSRRCLSKMTALNPDHVATRIAVATSKFDGYTLDTLVLEERIQALKDIIQDHPDSADAWINLARTRRYSTESSTHGSEAYEKALSLDPFNAVFVRSALQHYRYLGDQEEVTRLSSRLAQIIPETAEDRQLARVSNYGQISRARFDYVRSADPVALKEYEQLVSNLPDEMKGTVYQGWEERNVYVFRNDLESLVELAEKHNEPSALTVLDVSDFVDIQVAAMMVHYNAGRHNETKLIARRILETLNTPLFKRLSSINTNNIRDIGIANAILGNMEKAEVQLELLLKENTTTYGFPQAIGLMKWIDLERAVDTALKRKEIDPEFGLFDFLAAYHINEHAILKHPRMIEYYVDEGKWLQYLAERVPEYAEYKTSD
ncbi:MAG: hypothetical protein AB3N63_01985 [Puniceicoccaceae bacterium]